MFGRGQVGGKKSRFPEGLHLRRCWQTLCRKPALPSSTPPGSHLKDVGYCAVSIVSSSSATLWLAWLFRYSPPACAVGQWAKGATSLGISNIELELLPPSFPK